MKWRDIFLSWDFGVALLGAVITWWFLPTWTANSLAKELYGMGISVLAITFAVFFTALAVVAASGADDFVDFLRELGVYKGIVQTFRYTLVLLFVALLSSVVLFTFTVISMDRHYHGQARFIPVGFAFLFVYSLMAVILSTNDTLEYASKRIEFSEAKKRASESARRPQAPPTTPSL